MAVEENLEFRIGETWEIAITCNDADGSPLNLTGGDVQCRITGGPSPIALAVGSGVQLASDPTTGRAVISVTALQQSALTETLLRYEIRSVLSTGIISEQAFGSIYARRSNFAA